MNVHQQVTPANEFPDRTAVLIAGGGPVGSAVAVDLALRGIECLVVERRLFITPMVKAQELSAPTMEQFAQWGIADELRRRTPGHTHERIWFRGPLIERPLGVVSWVNPDSEQVAEAPHVTAQRHVNGILRERALELEVPHFFGWMLEDLQEHDEGVSVLLRTTDGHETRRIEAAYVVGADGSHSRTRTASGIERLETESLARHYNLGVRLPDLVERLGGEPTPGTNMVWMPDWHSMGSTVRYEDPDPSADHEAPVWRQIIGPFPPDFEMEDAEAVELTRQMVGADVSVEILWKKWFPIQERVAETYSKGRVALVGDAAHLFPPYMGQNMNIGLGDAANLGWKLAALVEGWGGPELLPSYSDERMPVARRTARSAITSWRTLLDVQAVVRDEGLPGADAPDDVRQRFLDRLNEMSYIEWNKDGVILDPRFERSAIVVDDGTPALPWEHTVYRPQCKAGHRLPHVWLPGGGGSIYRLLGPYFTLLNIAAGAEDVSAAAKAAAEAGVPLQVVDVTSHSLRDVYGADLVLARSDRYVAWRGDVPPSDVDLWDVVRGAVTQAGSTTGGQR